jgi:hypothetical protein
VVFYAVIRRDNLVGPMLTGARRHAGDVAPMTPAPWWRLAVAVAAAGVLAALIVRG